MRKPGPHGQSVLDDNEERGVKFRRAQSIADFGRLGADDEPVIRCSTKRCRQPATWWLCRPDGRESLRCDRHSLANATTTRRQIDPFDWHSLPGDRFS